MAWTVKAHDLAQNNGTTTGHDTSGADIIVWATAYFNGVAGVFSDNKGNSYGAGNVIAVYTNSSVSIQLQAIHNPNVGAGHTFSLAASSFGSFAYIAFSGAASSL